MTHAEILKRLQPVFDDLFGASELLLCDATRREDVPDWDSFTHILLLMSVESEFAIKFSAQEIVKIRDLPDLLRAIATEASADGGHP